MNRAEKKRNKEDFALLFRSIPGLENIFVEESQTPSYMCSTIPLSRKIAGILKPSSVEQVQKIVKIAGKYCLNLYPISTGKNWGYGSALPASDDNFIVDLSGLNQILHVDQKSCYAVLEPGVTQGQLYEYLKESNIPLRMDPGGAGPTVSIVGNVLERGYAMGRYGDHFQAMCGMEVVLPDGSLLRTGGPFEGSLSMHTFKWGVGPYIEGLFTQSAFGIVTKIGIWLQPEPEYLEACYFSVKSRAEMLTVIRELRYLLLHDIIPGPINIACRNRILTTRMQYPWSELSGKTSLGEQESSFLGKKEEVAPWTGMFCLSGRKSQVLATKKEVKKTLKKHANRITFISEKKIKFFEKYRFPLGVLLRKDISKLLSVIKPSFDAVCGVPPGFTLATPYWRNRQKNFSSGTKNPAQDNCGLIWYAPIIPLDAENVQEFLEIINPILEDFGFESCPGFLSVSSRCFVCTLPILFDKDSEEESQRAMECYQVLVREGNKRGYTPYRLGLQSMPESAEGNTYWKFIQQLKTSIDPQGIISPGRYCPMK